MKKYLFIAMALVAILSGCKKQNWLDWKAENEAWLTQNSINHDKDTLFHISSTGLQYRILSPGNKTDAQPGNSSNVRCTYTGRLITGAVFDSGSHEFPVASLTAGFAEGLKLIHVHGDIEIFVPWELGYTEKGFGTEGTQSYIPPFSTMIFTIHLDAVY